MSERLRCRRCGSEIYGAWREGEGYRCRVCKEWTAFDDAVWMGDAPPPIAGWDLWRDYPGRSEEDARALADRSRPAIEALGWALETSEWHKPSGFTRNGTLRLIYRPAPARVSGAPALPSGETKTCPDCAETVAAAARLCRFCRYEFTQAQA